MGSLPLPRLKAFNFVVQQKLYFATSDDHFVCFEKRMTSLFRIIPSILLQKSRMLFDVFLDRISV